MRKAFTMLELVMVMVIMGIIASIGAEIVASLYESYMKTRAIERLQSQTELVLDQIANRLQYRIKDSVIARDVVFANYTTLPNAISTYPILEWIGKDNEGFLGEHNGTAVVPGWSAFIDLDSAQTLNPNIHTRGSRLDFAENTLLALSNNTVSLTAGAGLQSPALIFKGKDSFNIAQYGWDGTDGNYTHRVRRNGNDILIFTEANPPTEIYEQYDLAWSAYALVPVGNANDFNLTLRYNYQPWENERYDNNASIAVLAEHVSTFRFTQVGDTIRLKLCISDANRSGTFDFAFCKEKVVY